MPAEKTPETWRPVSCRPVYEVSDLGRVRSKDRLIIENGGKTRRHPGRVLTPMRTPAGYRQVTLTGGPYLRRYVHRLVLEAFVGPCPAGMEGCHRNCDPSDNRLINLRWDYPKANVADTLLLGRKKEQKKTHCPRRHLLAMPNLVRGELPNRKCRACNRARAWVQRGGVPELFQSAADASYAEIMKAGAA